ncbi:MAG: hypothetical protein OEY59_06595 [Deltaproteobacteria bacterium]|nr:hypothetical protein [Deltaproteobacteria bacterium]
MKHFFEQESKISDTRLSKLLDIARQELKAAPMAFSEMVSKAALVCFNAGSVNDFVPKGLSSLITPRNFVVESVVNRNHIINLEKQIKEFSSNVIGIILGNIQTKNIHNYFDLIFDLDMDYDYPPLIATHFSDEDLIDYLRSFLTPKPEDKGPKKIEVFDDTRDVPWTTVFNPNELLLLDKGERKPAILDRPFFSDIHLKTTQGFQTKVVNYPYGKLRSVINIFNKSKNPTGQLVKSPNTIYLKWENIAGFKVSSSQSKYFQGISIKGEYISTQQFINKNIGRNLIKKEDVDYFKCRIGGRSIEVIPNEITRFEINLDNQQVVMLRGLTRNDNHIDRYRRLLLYKGNRPIQINRVIPFNRGEFNFETIQHYFASRYTELEKVKKIRKSNSELDYLSSQLVMSGDLTSQLTIASLKLLGLLPIEPHCIGFSPDDVKNPKKMKSQWEKWYQEISDLFKRILNVSQTPYFTDFNFTRLSKNMRSFAAIKDIDSITTENLEKSIDDLGKLTTYMDTFFQLDIYNKYQSDLESDDAPSQATPDEEETENPEELDSSKFAIDNKTKDFISENFSFFKKRDLIQEALLKTERMLFYAKHVKNFAEDVNFEPALIVYRDKNMLVKNYQMASYPSMALSAAINPGTIKFENEEKELYFVQFMRNFTKKVHQKASQLGQSFHHQYKHSLAELGFHLSEQKDKLAKELEFLENPKNREEIFNRLFEKVKGIYNQQLEAKKQSIRNLEKELEEVNQKKGEYRQQLEKQLAITIADGELEEVLEGMPDRLEKTRLELLERFTPKKNKISSVYSAYNKLYNANVVYFKRVLGYTKEFYKTILIIRRQQLIEQTKDIAKELFSMPPDALEKKMIDYSQKPPTQTQINEIQKAINENSEKLKNLTADLRQLSIKNLFQQKGKDKGILDEYLNYFKDESGKLMEFIEKLSKLYDQIRHTENLLFLKQEELVGIKVQGYRSDLLLKITKMIFDDPTCADEINRLLEFKEDIPVEIKKELASLRTQMNQSFKEFNQSVNKQVLEQMTDFQSILAESAKRDQINFTAKELVNFTQAIPALNWEIDGEKKDLDYLISQESQLDKVVMSKALPSTTTLIKTQYIPVIEREEKMLQQANDFLAEVISKENKIKEELVSAFFDKRHGFSQFVCGNSLIDSTQSTKNHTEKNINAAYTLLIEKYKAGCLHAQKYVSQIGLKKIDVQGIEGVKSRIAYIWNNKSPERVLYLPSFVKIHEALDICEYKHQLIRESPQSQRSVNSIVLVYINQFDYEKIRSNTDTLSSYHKAILSNVFINIDDVETFNNRESIYEACVKSTFGKGTDTISKQITHQFLHEV